MSIAEKLLDEPTLALLSGISKEKGQEHFRIFPRSVNTVRFIEYLEELREKNGEDKLCLFMDNLNVHINDTSTKKMKALGMRYVWNMSYSPEYNPIEFTFSKLKNTFRALRAKKLTGLIQDTHEALIVKAIRTLRKRDIVNCVNHV